MKNKKINYLFYVRYSLSGLVIYRCKTSDPFHVIGEMMYRELEHIEYVTFKEETKEALDYWKDNDIKIEEFVLKYENEEDKSSV